jgi:zinc protease
VSFVCAALGLGSLAGACAPPPGAGAPALARTAVPEVLSGPKTRVTFSLPNGVSAILEENHLTPTVALQVWIGAGSASEEAGQGGLAHLTERVVLGGAREDGGGAPPVAWTSFDETVFEAVVASPFAARRLDTMAAMLARAAFDAAEVERARADVLGESARAASSPAAVATNALFAAAFAGHGYGRPVVGTEATLRALTPADVATFHARAYAGAKMTIVAVGDFDARALRERVTAAFAGLPKGEPARDAPATAVAPAPPTVVALDGGEAHLAVGFRVGALDGDGLAALDVVAAVLARGGQGRLPRELVQNNLRAHDVRASVFHGRDGGLLIVDVTFVGRAERALRAVLDVASHARELSSFELDAARAAVEADLAAAQETAAGTARRLGRFRDRSKAADDYFESLQRLTLDEVAVSAASLVAPSKVFVAMVAPGRQPEGLATRLGRFVTNLAPHPPAPRATPMEARAGLVRTVLPSGLRVLVVREPRAASVVAHAVWSGGLRTEDARSNGVTSLLAATLPRGTRTRDAGRLAADLAALGGTLTASAGRDELGVAATFLTSGWEEGLGLLADCLRHPAFAEEEVESARRAALERVREREDDADVVAARLFASTLWPGHPYRLPLSGTAASLSGLTRRRLADHFQRFYGAANLTIAVVGDVDAGRVVEVLGALFSDAAPPLEAGLPPPPPPRASSAATEVFAVAAQDRAHVVLGVPGVPLADPDRPAAEVLVEILGGREDARGGRLARELAGVSLADASIWSGVDGGALVFELASAPSSIDDAVGALRAALDRVAGEAPPLAEVERARAALVNADARALERRSAVAAALARDEALGLPAGSYRRAGAALAAVTPERVERVARRLLDARYEIVAVVRPPATPTVAKAVSPKGAAPASPPQPLAGGRRPAAP